MWVDLVLEQWLCVHTHMIRRVMSPHSLGGYMYLYSCVTDNSYFSSTWCMVEVITGLTMEQSGYTKVWFTSTLTGIMCLLLTAVVGCWLRIPGLYGLVNAGLEDDVVDNEVMTFEKTLMLRTAIAWAFTVPGTWDAVVTMGLCDTIRKFDIRTTRLGNPDDRPKLLKVLRLLWPRTVKLLSREVCVV